MKKLVVVVALATMLAAGTAFADHPDGWGIGLVGRYANIGISTGYGADMGGGLSLKIPGVPVFWAINLDLGSVYGYSWFGVGITGDYYIIDKVLASEAFLHWYFGVGGFFNFLNYSYKYTWDDYSRTYMNFGVRVPVGLSFQPIPLLELFAEIAPSLGLNIVGGAEYRNEYGTQTTDKSEMKLYFKAPIGLGIRLWF